MKNLEDIEFELFKAPFRVPHPSEYFETYKLCQKHWHTRVFTSMACDHPFVLDGHGYFTHYKGLRFIGHSSDELFFENERGVLEQVSYEAIDPSEFTNNPDVEFVFTGNKVEKVINISYPYDYLTFFTAGHNCKNYFQHGTCSPVTHYNGFEITSVHEDGFNAIYNYKHDQVSFFEFVRNEDIDSSLFSFVPKQSKPVMEQLPPREISEEVEFFFGKVEKAWSPEDGIF